MALLAPGALSAWPPSTVTWSKAQAVKGFAGSYASMIRAGAQVMLFSNMSASRPSECPGVGCPGIVLYTGTSTTTVKQTGTVAPNAMINDVFGPDGKTLHPDRMFTRVSVARGVKDTQFYAVAHVAADYPPADGRVYPAFMTSPDGKSWTYRGQFKGEPWTMYGPGKTRSWASALAFIVNDAPAGLNTVNPLASRFVLISDAYAGRRLSLLHSADGITWYFARDKSGAVRELAPPELLSEGVIFPSVARTPFGYHMITTKNWPPEAQRHLYSCDGLSWTLLGKPTARGVTFIPPYGKNTNLYYDASTGLVQALETEGPKGNGAYDKKLVSFKPIAITCPTQQPVGSPPAPIPLGDGGAPG
jgi:hypothetical protein